jgi:hypothetical protein
MAGLTVLAIEMAESTVWRRNDSTKACGADPIRTQSQIAATPTMRLRDKRHGVMDHGACSEEPFIASSIPASAQSRSRASQRIRFAGSS